MAKRKRHSETTETTAHARPPRRSKRFLRRMGLLLLLVIGVLVAAPTIVAHTALRDTLLGKSLPAGWQIESQQASLGWVSSQTLAGVKITDAEGNLLLTVESITLPRSLITLAASQSDLGKLQLVRPTAYVETRVNGSNWEDFLVALQQQTQEQAKQNTTSTQTQTHVQLEVVDGAVRGFDRDTQRQWSLSEANLSATVGDATEVTGSARLATEQRPQPGQIKFRWQPDANGQQQLELLAEDLPLEPLEPWLSRLVPGAELAGTLSTDAQLTWTIDPQHGLLLETTGRLEANQLELTAAALAGDHLRSQRLIAPWKIQVVGEQLTLEQLAIDADWAKFEASGLLTLTELRELSLSKLPKSETKLTGKIDLAQLAAMLPRTLQLRQGVRIDAGQLQFNFAGKPDGDRPTWQATASIQNVVGQNVAGQDVAGTDGRRQIRWDEPIHLAVQLQATPTGPQVERLTLTAPFAKAEVQTQRDAITGEFELDLNEFSRELGQFVDLQTWQLRGLGEGTFTLSRQANQQFTAEAKVDLTDLHVAQSGQLLWTEPKLHVDLNATGTQHKLSPRAIIAGQVELRGPRDVFTLQLLQPVDLQTEKQTWNVQVEGNGPLELWAGRLRPWLTSVPQRLEGDAHLRAELEIATDAIHVKSSQGSVVQLRVESDTLTIDEPRVEFSGDASWNRQTGSLVTHEMQLMGSSLSFRARDVAVALAAQGAPTARGSVAFRADLERLAAMAGLVGQTTATWPRGNVAGQLQLSSDAQQLQANFNAKAQQLELVRTTASSGAVYGRPEILWTEPQLEVTGKAKYLLADDRIELEQLQVNGKTLRLNGSAILDQLSSAGLLQANGLVEYDPAELAKLVASYGGQGIQLQGDQQVRFQVAGPLFESGNGVPKHWSERWQATAEAGWSSAALYGLPLSSGKLQGTLRDGQLQIAPLDVAIGQGRLTASPRAILTPGAEQIFLPKGLLISNVAISPEVSETMLKYVAPILAGATRAEGQFSIDLDQTEVPLAKPEQAHVQGRLAVHRLNISPGPMVAQLATLIKQVESLTKGKQFLQTSAAPRNKAILTVSERQIDFKVVEGRVYHRNLEFLIDGVPVRSSGSVGFDQTLALVIEVPIQDQWIEREKALRSLAGQSLRIPIYGTFQKPKIDKRAVANLSAQLLQGAASQAIGDELNRQFDKLFRGK